MARFRRKIDDAEVEIKWYADGYVVHDAVYNKILCRIKKLSDILHDYDPLDEMGRYWRECHNRNRHAIDDRRTTSDEVNNLIGKKLTTILPDFIRYLDIPNPSHICGDADTIGLTLLAIPHHDNLREVSSWIMGVANTIMNETMCRIKNLERIVECRTLPQRHAGQGERSVACWINGSWRVGWEYLNSRGLDCVVVSCAVVVGVSFCITKTVNPHGFKLHVYVDPMPGDNYLGLWCPSFEPGY